MLTGWQHTRSSASTLRRGFGVPSRVGNARQKRCKATSPGAGNIVPSADLSALLQQLMTEGSAEQSLQPHFGSAAISHAFDQAAQAVSSSLPDSLPSMPQGSLPAVSNTDPISSLFQLGPTSFQPPTIPLPDTSSLPPHFGTQFVTHLLTSLSSSLSSQISALHLTDSESARALTSTLTQLKAATDLLTSLPSTTATTALQTLSSTPTGASLATSLTSLTSATSSALTSTLTAIHSLTSAASSQLSSLPSPETALLTATTALANAQANGISGVQFSTFCLICAAALATTAASTPRPGYQGITTVPDMQLTPEYSPDYLDEYFQRRPVEVMRRSAEVAEKLSRFGLGVLTDIWSGNLKVNEARRAVELREVIEQLGPAYVKVAQAVSTRVDLLPPEYFKQIQLLQDRVPPFPCSVAREVIQGELGLAVETVFSELSERPIAAASLGQVYRGTLRDKYGGGEVAVKVQRPGVLQQVALDLYIMRGVAQKLVDMPEVQTDWVALIDTWAQRFFHEMDYRREAQNAIVFTEQMAALEGIVVPEPNLQLTTDSVLVSAWIDGEKLSESRAEDVRELCNTMLNCYLIQLLDTGFLHADPHPGNLIRTVDGKIAILDYGLMTEVTEEQRIALTEYIAHLLTEDWPNVAVDLQKLGFIPPEVRNVQGSALVAPLSSILRQLSGGGGATKLNIDQVMGELEDLGRNYPFQIPAFFALILRAFSVIEGIALGVDPDYAIVQECFPYISRRLLRDDSPRTKKVLRDVLYGGRQRLDVARLQRLADAFQSYTTEGLAANAPSSTSQGAVDPMVKEALVAVFSQRGTYVQQLLVEELVAAVDALSREALSTVVVRVLGSAPAAVAMTTVERLGPLRPLVLPFLTPPEILSRLAPAVAVTPEDKEALDVVKGILQLAQRLPAPDVRTTPDLVRAVPEVAPLVRELAPGVLHTGELFTRQFLRRLALRTAAELGRASVGTDYESAMAALGFMPSTPPPSAPSNPAPAMAFTSQAPPPSTSFTSSPASTSQPQLQPQQFAPAALVAAQLALAAAPLALAAAPLALVAAAPLLPLALIGHFAYHGLLGTSKATADSGSSTAPGARKA